MAEDLWKQTANDLAQMIAAGEVSSLEVVDAHLDRIEEVNGWLNAVTRVLTDEARAAAIDADAAVAAGAVVSVLLLHVEATSSAATTTACFLTVRVCHPSPEGGGATPEPSGVDTRNGVLFRRSGSNLMHSPG